MNEDKTELSSHFQHKSIQLVGRRYLVKITSEWTTRKL